MGRGIALMDGNMKTNTVIGIAAALGIGYFLLKGSGGDSGGDYSGSFPLPDALLPSSPGVSEPVGQTQITPAGQTQPFAISSIIQDAMFASQFSTKKVTTVGSGDTTKNYTVPQPNIWTILGLNQTAVNPYALAKSAKTGNTVYLGSAGGKDYVTGFGDIKLTSNTVAVNPYVLTAQPNGAVAATKKAGYMPYTNTYSGGVTVAETAADNTYANTLYRNINNGQLRNVYGQSAKASLDTGIWKKV